MAKWSAAKKLQITDDSFTSFECKWKVPPPPKDPNKGQQIFLFNSITTLPNIIYQPVLFWGNYAIPGINLGQAGKWNIASFKIDTATNNYNASSGSYVVNPGDELTGFLTQIKKANGKYIITAEFKNFPNTRLSLDDQNVPASRLDVVLEHYKNFGSTIDDYNQLPETPFTNFYDFSISGVPDPNQWLLVDPNSNGGLVNFADTYWRNGKIGITLFYNSMMLLWKGGNGDNTLYSSFGGRAQNVLKWGTPTNTGLQTSTSVSAAMYRGKLYVAYKEANNNNLYLSSFDGNSWSAGTQIKDFKSSHAPSLVVYTSNANENQKLLFLTWKSENNQDINFSSWDGIADWRSLTKLGGRATNMSICLTNTYGINETNRVPFTFWKGMVNNHGSDDQNMWYSKFTGSYGNPTSWNAQSSVSVPGNGKASKCAPAVCQGLVASTIFLAWRGMAGPGGDDQGLWISVFDSVSNTFTQQQHYHGSSRCSPSVAKFGKRIYMVWRGMSNDEAIWFTEYNSGNLGELGDPSKWVPQKSIESTFSAGTPLGNSFKTSDSPFLVSFERIENLFAGA